MKSAQVVRIAALSAFVGIASTASAQWSDNFDSYAGGSGLAGQGGWEIWCDPGGLDGVVDTAFAFSGANSLRIDSVSDVVHRLGNATTGQHVVSVMTYVPGNATGIGYIIIMQEYCLPAHMWATSTSFDADIGWVDGWGGTGSVELIYDQWVEYRIEIDLDNDTMSEFYGTTQFNFDIPYSTNAGGSKTQIDAIDLYSDSIDSMYFDDVGIQAVGACPCACDFDLSTGPKTCDIFDFLAFQNGFVGADACACDIDVSTGPATCDIFDFLAFQNGFVAGCP